MGIICVACLEFTGLHKKRAPCFQVIGSDSIVVMLFVLAQVGLPSLHDNHACVVSWNEGALRGNCRRTHSKTSLSPVWAFLLCRNYL